jgi:FkbM family methyltransferase
MLHGVEAFVNHNKQVFGEEGPKIILDVGTRDLAESIEIAGVFPNATILAFEPNPSQFQYCLERSQQHPNIRVFEYAITDVEGPLDFYVVGLNYGGSSLLEPIDVPYSDKTHVKVTVQGRRLDSVLAELGIEKVDSIWMDVQGNELKAIQGLGKYLDTVQIMHTEACPNPYYVGHQSKTELEAYVASQGFDYRFEVHNGHPYGEGDLICSRK